MKDRSDSGFTLIELLVVMSIIATLAAILFPVFAQAREKSRETTCASNMRQVSASIIFYTQDYDGGFPLHQFSTGYSDYASLPPSDKKPWNNGNWIWSTHAYNTSWQVLLCPSAQKKDGYGDTTPPILYTNYTMNGYLHGRSETEVESPSDTFLLLEGVGQNALDGYGACYPVPVWSPPDPTISQYIFFIRDGLGVNHNGGSIYTYVDGHVKWQASPGMQGMVNHLPISTSSDFNIRLFTPWQD